MKDTDKLKFDDAFASNVSKARGLSNRHDHAMLALEQRKAAQVPGCDPNPPSAIKDQLKAEAEAFFNRFTYDPVAMRAALDKKLIRNRAKYAEDMQYTQTGELIEPQYVFNAERQQIINEKQKPAPQPECQQPKPQSLFGRFLRWLTSDGDGIRPMSVHEMQQFDKGSK